MMRSKLLVLVVALALGTLCVVGSAWAQDDATTKKLKALADRLDKLERAAGAGDVGSDLRVYWDNGLNLVSRDGDFRMKIGGRVHVDAGWINEDSKLQGTDGGSPTGVGDQDDYAEIRRARLYMSGVIYGNVDYMLEAEFTEEPASSGCGSTTSTSITDAYVSLHGDCIRVFQVGKFKEPFSLEAVASNNFITFMERALPVQAFAPGRGVGAAIFSNVGKRMTYALGVFRAAFKSEGGYNVTGRVTGLPVYEEDGKRLVHVGAAASYRDAQARDDCELRYHSTPELHQAKCHSSYDWVDTGSDIVGPENVLLWGLEAATVWGPCSMQAEYMRADVEVASSVVFDGWYVLGSYFLTGENRNYSTTNGAFTRVKPLNNFGKDGWGAWELSGRYSTVDLNDSSHNVQGGELDNITVGLNWYLNPSTRFMLNYIYADLKDSGEANMLGARFQVDW